MNFEISSYFIQKSPSFKNFAWYLHYPFGIEYIDKVFELFPTNTQYSLFEFSSEEKKDWLAIANNFDENVNLIDSLCKLHISTIILWYILPDEDYQFICRLLKFPNTINFLTQADLKLNSLSEALNILNLLSYWSSISVVNLQYLSSKDIATPESSIREAKRKFTKKIGIISQLKISLIETKS